VAGSLAMTRDALACFDQLPDPMLREITMWHSRLAKELEQGRVLGETFRHCAQTILQRLAPTANVGEHRDQLDAALCKLQDALKLSLRASDLLTAEREVAHVRGITPRAGADLGWRGPSQRCTLRRSFRPTVGASPYSSRCWSRMSAAEGDEHEPRKTNRPDRRGCCQAHRKRRGEPGRQTKRNGRHHHEYLVSCVAACAMLTPLLSATLINDP
jgi:hypothetical protein